MYLYFVKSCKPLVTSLALALMWRERPRGTDGKRLLPTRASGLRKNGRSEGDR